MRITMQSDLNPNDLELTLWDYAITGDAVDLRGEAAVAFAKTHSRETHNFRYNPKTLQVHFNDKTFDAEEPECILANMSKGSVLLETTTLSFVDILLCCRALKQNCNRELHLVYTEPKNYFKPQRSHISHRRKFDLSDEVEEFTGVPGNTILIMGERPLKVVVFVGFEGQRLSRLLEQTSILPSKCEITFGVPAFHAGWEMDAFSNNLNVLKGSEIASRVHFCGAQNPLSAYDTLQKIFDSCYDERLLVAPIGTKPHGIGTALFLCEHPNVGVVYDNPKRKEKRTENVETWHLFHAEF